MRAPVLQSITKDDKYKIVYHYVASLYYDHEAYGFTILDAKDEILMNTFSRHCIFVSPYTPAPEDNYFDDFYVYDKVNNLLKIESNYAREEFYIDLQLKNILPIKIQIGDITESVVMSDTFQFNFKHKSVFANAPWIPANDFEYVMNGYSHAIRELKTNEIKNMGLEELIEFGKIL